MDGNSFVGVLSQSLLAAVVVSKHGIRGDHGKGWATGNRSIKDLGIIETDIVSVGEHDSVMDALLRMHLSNISSVAIMNHRKVWVS
jgi:CBS domain-containing protein